MHFSNLQPKNGLGLCEISLHAVTWIRINEICYTLPNQKKIYAMTTFFHWEFLQMLTLFSSQFPIDECSHASKNVQSFVCIHTELTVVQYFTTFSWLGCDFNAKPIKTSMDWLYLTIDDVHMYIRAIAIKRLSIHCRRSFYYSYHHDKIHSIHVIC